MYYSGLFQNAHLYLRILQNIRPKFRNALETFYPYEFGPHLYKRPIFDPTILS